MASFWDSGLFLPLYGIFVVFERHIVKTLADAERGLDAAAFTLIAAFIGHRYWSVPADQYANQMAHFMKDIAIVGGFLALFAAGAGAISIDRR